MLRLLRTVVLVAASLLSAYRAGAQETPAARLEVKSAPESGCVDAASLGAQVEERLGHRAFEQDARLLVRVTLAPKAPRGWSARLELLNTRGELFGAREIATDSEACRELDSSLALVTALLVDSPAATRAAQSETVETVPPAAESQPPPAGPAKTLAPVRVEDEPWRVMPSAAFAALFAYTPRPLFGLRVGVEVKPPGFIWFGIEATLYGAREIPDDEFDVSAEVRHGTVGFFACPWTTRTTVELGVCFGQEIGYTAAAASGFDVNHEPTRLDATTFGRLALDVPVFFPLRLKAGLTGGVPLVRDRYIFSGPDQQVHEFFRTGSIVAIGQLGIAVRLP